MDNEMWRTDKLDTGKHYVCRRKKRSSLTWAALTCGLWRIRRVVTRKACFVPVGICAVIFMLGAAYHSNFRHEMHAFTICNEKLCRAENGSEIAGLVLLLIKSRVDAFAQRRIIRRTWGDRCWIKRYQNQLNIAFVVGRSNVADSHRVEHLLRMEAEKHGDIVQYDFPDSYRLLLHKVTAGLEFVRKHCHAFRFVLLGDDDVVINPIRLMEFASAISPTDYEHFVGGRLFNNTYPIRDKRYKHYTAYNEYPDAAYPPYTAGPATLISMPAAMRILDELLWMPVYIAWDDVAVGFALKRSGIVPKHIASIQILSKLDKKIQFRYLIAFHRFTNQEEVQRLWIVFNMSAMCRY